MFDSKNVLFIIMFQILYTPQPYLNMFPDLVAQQKSLCPEKFHQGNNEFES